MGVTFDIMFSFDLHIQNVVKKAKGMIGLIEIAFPLFRHCAVFSHAARQSQDSSLDAKEPAAEQ